MATIYHKTRQAFGLVYASNTQGKRQRSNFVYGKGNCEIRKRRAASWIYF